MLVLDTNVISEALKPEPNAKVRAWLEVQPAASVFTTAISQAEILYGVALLPKGRRQSILLTAAVSMFEEDFRGRVLPFNSEAATIYASLGVGPPARRSPYFLRRRADCGRHTIARRSLGNP